MQRAFAALIAVVGLAFVLTIGWASTTGGVIEGFARVADEPWGLVGLIDLYLGFIIAGGWILAVERNRKAAVAMVIALPFLGNVVPLGYLVWRAWNAKTWREVFLSSSRDSPVP